MSETCRRGGGGWVGGGCSFSAMSETVDGVGGWGSCSFSAMSETVDGVGGGAAVFQQ